MRAIWMAVAIPLAACGSGSAEGSASGPTAAQAADTRQFDLRDFDRVALLGPDDVEVRTGAAFSVTARGNPRLLAELEIETIDGELRIGRRDRASMSWSSRGGLTIQVIMPAIRAASLMGSGDLAVDRAVGDGFDAKLAGSGNLTIASVQSDEVKLTIAGSGTLSAAGSADRLAMAIRGSGDIRAADLSARAADVSIAGSGDARAAVTGPAQVSLVGSGSADLGPAARCTVSKVGSGEARCGG